MTPGVMRAGSALLIGLAMAVLADPPRSLIAGALIITALCLLEWAHEDES